MLRQGDAGVFERYSQAKLNMMRELSKDWTVGPMNTKGVLVQRGQLGRFGTVLLQKRTEDGHGNWRDIGTKGVSWCAWRDSNPRPVAPEASLTYSYHFIISHLFYGCLPLGGICSRSQVILYPQLIDS